MNKTLAKIWGIVGNVVVVLAVALAVLVVGVRLIGIKTYAVISGSDSGGSSGSGGHKPVIK